MHVKLNYDINDVKNQSGYKRKLREYLFLAFYRQDQSMASSYARLINFITYAGNKGGSFERCSCNMDTADRY